MVGSEYRYFYYNSYDDLINSFKQFEQSTNTLFESRSSKRFAARISGIVVCSDRSVDLDRRCVLVNSSAFLK